MPGGHERRRPKCDEKSRVERMPDEAVEPRSLKRRAVELGPSEMSPDLLQAEKLEVVHQERAEKQNSPADPGQQAQRHVGKTAAHVPDQLRKGPPLPQQQRQGSACENDIGAAFDVPRNHLRPAALETLPRHDAVLDGKNAEQSQVDDDGLRRRRYEAVIDRPRNKNAAHETDRVGKRPQEEQIGKHTIKKNQCSLHKHLGDMEGHRSHRLTFQGLLESVARIGPSAGRDRAARSALSLNHAQSFLKLFLMPAMSHEIQHLYEFGSFRLDPSQQVLMEGKKKVPLTPKAFQTLLVLVESHGRVIGKDELLARVWPDVFVEEATLAQNVFTLRKQL